MPEPKTQLALAALSALASHTEMLKSVEISRNERPPRNRVVGSSPVGVPKKPKRNKHCPCGSGKKYKNCHGLPPVTSIIRNYKENEKTLTVVDDDETAAEVG